MESFPLTIPQQNIWNLQRYYGDSAIANLCGAIFFVGRRDSALLQETVRRYLRSQSGLRLRFFEENTPKQFVAKEIEESIPIMNFVSRESFDQYAKTLAKEPIGLINRAMYRFVVFTVEGESGKNSSGILVVLSHLISDAWTFALLADGLNRIYLNLSEGEELLIPEGDYTDYIHSENAYLFSERYKKDRIFWEEKYAVCPVESPVKLHLSCSDSVEAERITQSLSLTLEKQMEAYCRSKPVTMAVLFETALIVYLFRTNPENHRITLGVPLLNRSSVREKQIAGMFVSTMPLTIELTERMTASELSAEITREHMRLFRHQKYPYSDILRFLREKQKFSGSLYDVMVSYQNARTNTGADTKWYFNGYSEIPLAIHIDNRDGKKCHTLNIDYQTAVFQEEEIYYLIGRLEYILEQITEDDQRAVREISILPQQEKEKVINSFNNTAADYPGDKCIHELFTDQAGKTPDRVAVVFEDRKFTYRQIDEMSNSLARFLREKGVMPNDIVPIIARRSWHMIAAMLGVLKAGGAYMPVDPEYPADRVEYMMQAAGCALILEYDCTCQEKEPDGGTERIDLQDFDFRENIKPLSSVNSPEDLCYVIFTSGSTGMPKGVSICHRNVVNYCQDNEKNVCYSIIRDDYQKMVSVTNFVFDIFVTESLLCLLCGKTVYLANEEEALRQDKLSGLISRNQIEILQTTPTKMRSYILERDNLSYLQSLKVIILGGEAFPIDLYKVLREHTDAHIYNIYGPAETTVWSANGEVGDGDITIGTPIANTQIYILDQDGIPVPVGVSGELCIAGAGVGKGYLNRPELTAEKFVPNPFATEKNGHGKTMYRTGDLARWRADGEIEYLGRIDTQVKIRGLRVELGEIESVMGSFPGIGLCAVADKKDETGRQYLVGYYTLAVDAERQGETDSGEVHTVSNIDEKILRKHLSAKLPRYMVPNYFMRLDAIPMTPSGKIDRKNLPLPESAVQAEVYEAPVTEREKRLCRLLEALFRLEWVGRCDDFFEIGGDSLRAIEYVARAHDIGVDFALQNVFDYPTVQSLCEFLDRGKTQVISYRVDEFDRYEGLLSENRICGTFSPRERSLGNVLLTGATGFLGAHVLDVLMREEKGKVYCLVRDSGESGSIRLKETLRYYFSNKYGQEPGNRIIPIVGDMEQEELSKILPRDVQTVLHTAASVKHYGSYDYFRRVNVEGTRHIAAFAKAVGAKLIHISTLSVSGNTMADDFTVYRSKEEKYFDETSLYIGQPLDNVYVRSKFEAEKLVYDAMLDGLEAVVIRVGNLTNRLSDFKFQPNYRENAFLTRVKAILEFGMFPDYLMSLYSEFSPVDLTAEGIVKIARQTGRQCVFHLNSNHPVYFDRFLEIVQNLKIPMQIVDGMSFSKALEQTMKKTGTEYIYEALQNDMDEQGRLVYDSNIRIDNDFTVWFMKKLGFEWNEMDMDYIKGYIEYFRNLGYLEV